MTSTSRGALDAAALELLALQVRTGLGAVQRVQVEYDKSMWDIDDPVFANLRHIQLHLSITVGKLAKLIEPRDHDTFHGRQVPEIASDDIAPIIADLLMHATQVANILDRDLADDFLARYRTNAARFVPDSPLRHIGN